MSESRTLDIGHWTLDYPADTQYKVNRICTTRSKVPRPKSKVCLSRGRWTLDIGLWTNNSDARFLACNYLELGIESPRFNLADGLYSSHDTENPKADLHR